MTTRDIANTAVVEKAMVAQYDAHARELLPKRLQSLFENTTWLRMSQTPRVTYKRMKLRWGSTTPGGRISLNVLTW